jgi:hypothetical protein
VDVAGSARRVQALPQDKTVDVECGALFHAHPVLYREKSMARGPGDAPAAVTHPCDVQSHDRRPLVECLRSHSPAINTCGTVTAIKVQPASRRRQAAGNRQVGPADVAPRGVERRFAGCFESRRGRASRASRAPSRSSCWWRSNTRARSSRRVVPGQIDGRGASPSSSMAAIRGLYWPAAGYV